MPTFGRWCLTLALTVGWLTVRTSARGEEGVSVFRYVDVHGEHVYVRDPVLVPVERRHTLVQVNLAEEIKERQLEARLKRDAYEQKASATRARSSVQRKVLVASSRSTLEKNLCGASQNLRWPLRVLQLVSIHFAWLSALVVIVLLFTVTPWVQRFIDIEIWRRFVLCVTPLLLGIALASFFFNISRSAPRVLSRGGDMCDPTSPGSISPVEQAHQYVKQLREQRNRLIEERNQQIEEATADPTRAVHPSRE